MGFCVLLIALFFKKRATFARFYIAFLLFRAFDALIDHFGSQIILGNAQELAPQDRRVLIRAILPCLIWIPYMLKSRRVKATFVR